MDLVNDIRAQGVSIVWIEHVVHALLAVASRLLVINFGAKLAEGEPRAVMASPGSQARLHGDRGLIMAEMLEVRNLVAKYGDFQALFGIDFAMAQGSIVALIGANGAGKSTFLKAIAGQMANKQGEIRFEDREIGLLSSDEIVATGIAMVPEGRRLFRSLTVEENLKVGAFSGRTGRWTLDTVYALFPVLKERRQNAATALSGGPAADGRDRPRADVEPAPSPLR